MKLLVLATLAAVAAMAAMAVGRPLKCDDHCRIKFSMQLMLRAHDSICDCSKFAKAGRQQRPVLTQGTTFQLNDSDIYFQPVKLHHDDGAYYIEKPFHILNPTVNFRRKPSKAPNNVAINGKNNELLQFADLNKKTYANKSDSEILCVDLHALVVARKHNNVSELMKTWETRKFNTLSKLSDDEIKRGMQQDCKETMEFVMLSYEEIVDNRPKKQVTSNTANLISKEPSSANPTENEPSKQTKPSQVFPVANNPDSYVTSKNANTAETTTLVTKFTDDDTLGSLDANEPSGLFNENNTTNNSNDFPAPSVDTNNATALSSNLFHTPVQDSIMVGTNITTRSSDPLLKTAADTKDENIFAQIKINPETSKTLESRELFDNKISRPNARDKKGDNSQSSDYLDNLTSYSEMQDRKAAQWITARDLKSAMNDDDAETKTSNRSNNKYPNPKTTSQYKKAFGLVTVIYAEGRPIYDENEVSPQRVITREFVNGTVQSVINGTEDMNREEFLNNDNNDTEFVDVAFVSSGNDWEGTDNPMDATGTDLGDAEMGDHTHSHG